MRKHFWIFYFLFLFSCSEVKILSLDPEKETLKSSVRVITQHEYDAVKPSTRSPFTIQHAIIQFGKNGRKTDENRFDSDTNITAMWFFTYNKKNLLQEEKWLNPDSSIAYRVEYQYNAKFQIISEKHYSTDNLLDNSVYYSYNSEGFAELKLTYDNDSILLVKTRFYYLPGRVNEVIYTPENILKTIISYRIDEKGNVLAVSEFGELGECMERTAYHYEAYGNLKEIKEDNLSDSTFQRYYYKYEYDKRGNWTMKMELKNDIPSKIILREYGYY